MQSNIATCVFFQGRLKEVREEEEGPGRGGWGGGNHSVSLFKCHTVLNEFVCGYEGELNLSSLS